MYRRYRRGLRRMAFDYGHHFGHALPGEISFQIAQDITCTEPLVFQASAGLDCNNSFSLTGIAHPKRRRNGGPANKCADLEDLSGANFRKMINQDQHVQMQHRMFVTDLKQLRMNRLLSVLHESMHQVQAIIEVAVTAHGFRSLQCRPGDCVVARGTMSSHHNEVTLHSIEPRNTWKQSPALEPEPLKQFQTRCVVREDKTDNCVDPERRRTRDCLFQQLPCYHATAKFLIDINADFGGAAISAARQECFEIQPTNHAAVKFRYPEWMLVRRMIAEPRQTRFNSGRLKLSRYHARRHSRIVNLDDGREIRF